MQLKMASLCDQFRSELTRFQKHFEGLGPDYKATFHQDDKTGIVVTEIKGKYTVKIFAIPTDNFYILHDNGLYNKKLKKKPTIQQLYIHSKIKFICYDLDIQFLREKMIRRVKKPLTLDAVLLFTNDVIEVLENM